MNEQELARKVIQTFEKLSIRYFVTGGMAAIAYGEPRFTSDIDVVADVPLDQVSALIAEFPYPEFYEWAAKLDVSNEWELVPKRVDEAAP